MNDIIKIKTIRCRTNSHDVFDHEVNEALADGWELSKRYETDPTSDSLYRMLVAELVKRHVVDDEMKIKVKYFLPLLEPLEKISVGDWIDLRAAESVTLRAGDYHLIRLGVGMILPDGYEAHILPRSSTPLKFGIICANSMGVIDNSYSGDNDEWHFPAFAIKDTTIQKGDRIAQFRIVKNQPRILFETVSHLNETSRGGIGSTGTR